MEHQIAARYAEALFSLAREKGEEDRVEADLAAVYSLLQEAPDLGRVFDHPEMPLERKVHLLEQVFGEVQPITLSFVKLLVRRGRSALVGIVGEEYALLADAARGVAEVEVASAVELTADQQNRVRQALERLTGKKVKLRAQVEPGLLASVRVQIGDRRIDGSAAGRLEALGAKLKEAAGAI